MKIIVNIKASDPCKIQVISFDGFEEKFGLHDLTNPKDCILADAFCKTKNLQE